MTLSPKILAANEDSREEAAASRGPDEGTLTERDTRPQVIPEPPDEYLRRDVRARLYGHRLFAAMGNFLSTAGKWPAVYRLREPD